MASSPAEPQAERTLRALQTVYDHAYEALARGDVERAQSVLQQAELLLGALPAAATDSPKAQQLRAQARDRHGAVLAATRTAMAQVQKDLGQVRRGQRGLRGYADLVSRLGDHFESRG
ncbi:MAG TPA: hypothetical protein VK348_05860 [Planctomycetota bacterium]|nr:hypothetical protein [Planctomycetota bacterium]